MRTSDAESHVSCMTMSHSGWRRWRSTPPEWKARTEHPLTRQPVRSVTDSIKLSEDVHALSYRLHPSVIEDLGLVEALRAECERVTRSGAVTVQFNASEVPRKLPQDTALCLFRVAQEALRNVVRHAGASSVEVSVSPTGRRTAACGQRRRYRFRPRQTRRAAEPRTRKHQGTGEPAQGRGRYRQRSKGMAQLCSHGSPYRWSRK